MVYISHYVIQYLIGFYDLIKRERLTLLPQALLFTTTTHDNFVSQALLDSKTTESMRNKIMSEYNEMQSNLEQDMTQKRNLHKQELKVWQYQWL